MNGKNIGYVPQQSILIDDKSKRTLLGVADEDIDINKILNCLREVQLDKFVNNLEFGIDTFVGEKGIKISGGQRQRIAIKSIVQQP